MTHTYQEIKEQVKEFILRDQSSEEEFNQLALKLFAYQYTHNQALRKFWRQRRVSPTQITRYTQIPPVPQTAFKQAILACTPIEETEAVFMTSGTTNSEMRGKNYHRDLEIYNLSMKKNFKQYILPDVEKIKMVVLFPKAEELPNSSLAHYLQLAYHSFGTENSSYVVSTQGFDQDQLIADLQQAEREEEAVLLIGATFSFIHFLDTCMERGLRFNLPEGSRIMDTGGAKGKSRAEDPQELKKNLGQLLGLSESHCLNMYGMTELSSQIYDADLVYELNHVSTVEPSKLTPHWMRTRIVEPMTLQEQARGEKGIIVHYDLANFHSACAIMTEDIGVTVGEGFHLLGRAEGSEAKGCSLAVEEFLRAAKGV